MKDREREWDVQVRSGKWRPQATSESTPISIHFICTFLPSFLPFHSSLEITTLVETNLSLFNLFIFPNPDFLFLVAPQGKYCWSNILSLISKILPQQSLDTMCLNDVKQRNGLLYKYNNGFTLCNSWFWFMNLIGHAVFF